MAIITYPLEDIEYTAADAETYLCTRTSGVYSDSGHFALTITGARTVEISSGLAWINSGDFSGKSVCNTATVELTFDLASAQSRIDRIVLRFDKTRNLSEIAIKKGTESSSPVAPAVERSASIYELGLYIVQIALGAVSISANDIQSTMLDSNVCGIMKDGVTGIPADDLLARLQTDINNIEIGSAVMLKAIYDADSDGVVDVAKTAQDCVLTSDYTADMANKANLGGWTASRVLGTNSSGRIAVSPVTITELNRLSGVTSGVQAQINSKQDALTFDSSPQSGSSNPVTSGGVYSAVHDAATRQAPMDSLNANKTLSSTDAGKWFNCMNSSSITITVPSSAPNGTEILFLRYGAGAVSFVAPSGISIVSAGGTTILDQYGVACLKKTGGNTWTLFGDV